VERVRGIAIVDLIGFSNDRRKRRQTKRQSYPYSSRWTWVPLAGVEAETRMEILESDDEQWLDHEQSWKCKLKTSIHGCKQQGSSIESCLSCTCPWIHRSHTLDLERSCHMKYARSIEKSGTMVALLRSRQLVDFAAMIVLLI
jgi:hypothetical protein